VPDIPRAAFRASQAEQGEVDEIEVTALERRRCLVHADAFYEWRAMPDGKQPYAIRRKDGGPLAFAGGESWRGRTAKPCGASPF